MFVARSFVRVVLASAVASLGAVTHSQAAIVYTGSFPTSFWGNPVTSQDMGGGEWQGTMFVIHFTGTSFNNDYFSTNFANVFRTYATFPDPGSDPPSYIPVPANVNQYGADRHTITDLAFGSTVSSGLTWSTSGDALTTGSGKYWGLESTEGGNVYYGWIRYDMSDGGKTLYFVDAAFNDVPGAPITVGAVPEPSTYAMALVGIACGGWVVRRRRSRS